MKRQTFIIIVFIIWYYNINAQVTTFTLNGGVISTTLTAPLNNGASMTFTPLGIPANYNVKMTGYYLTPGYVPANVLMFDNAHASTNNAGHVIVNTTATSCTMTLISSFYMSEMDLVAYDASNVPQWRWYIFNSIPTAIAETEEALPLSIYPNPATDQINIVENEQFNEPVTVNLYNSVGQLVLTETFPQSPEPKTLNIEKLDKGIYSLQLISGERRTIRRIVKE